MALQLNKSLPFGLDANYWRITGIGIDYNRNDAHIVMSLYKDKTRRDSNPKDGILDSRDFSFDLNGFGADLRASAYTKIKALDEWSKATDI